MSLFIFIHHYAPLLCGENPYLLLLAAFYFINKIYLENFKRRKCFFSNEGESAFASALISHLKSFPLGIAPKKPVLFTIFSSSKNPDRFSSNRVNSIQ